MFNHICTGLFSGCLSLVNHVRSYCLAIDAIKLRILPSQSLSQKLINLVDMSASYSATKSGLSKTSMVHSMLRDTKNSKEKNLNEKSLLWAIKLCRLTNGKASDDLASSSEPNNQRSLSLIFDYFVRREVAKRLAAERAERGEADGEQVFHVPFKVR